MRVEPHTAFPRELEYSIRHDGRMQTNTLEARRAASLKASEHALFPNLHIAESTRRPSARCQVPGRTGSLHTVGYYHLVQTVNETHSAVKGPQNAVTQT